MPGDVSGVPDGVACVSSGGGDPVLDHVLILLCRIADHRDRHGAPIDCQRRRDLVPTDPIDWPTWPTPHAHLPATSGTGRHRATPSSRARRCRA
ncbi:predicted protein [Streptomyces sp. AA4]|nr:predicted protein [Streptomyces sp. AA4]